MTGWIASTLMATALLMLFVLMLRPFVRRAFGAGAACALWLIPALRLITPTIELGGVVASPLAPIDIALAAAGAAPSGGAWLVWAWAAGALLFAGWHVAGYRRFIARMSADARLLASGVVATRAVDGPAAIGLLVGRILVPHDFADRFSPVEQDLALRHERVHLARGDLWANAAALGLLSLHWFNPLAHVAYRAFRQDQELSCDAAVIAAAGSEERAAYGSAMVKSAWAAAPMTTCPMTRSGNLKWRLKMIRNHRKSVLARVGGSACIGMLALAGLTLTATGGIAAAPDEAARKVVIEVRQVVGGQAGNAAVDRTVKDRCGSDEDRFETRAVSDLDGKPFKSRVIFCAKQGGAEFATGTDRLKTLEGVRTGLMTAENATPEQRARAVASVDALIAKLKAK